MKRALVLFVFALMFPAGAAEIQPSWAFFSPDANQPAAAPESAGPKQVPGSKRNYSMAQIDDLKNPPDWFPGEHPPMPNVVAHGGQGMVLGCASCHLASGMGHPESASLAGLKPAYMQRQLADFKNAARRNAIVLDGKPQMNATEYMINVAQGLSDADAKAASQWFSRLKPQRNWVKVVEAANVPKSYITRGFMRVAEPGGGMEPIGNRIIELPQDVNRQVLRDPHSGTVAYVPPGAIARGRALASTGRACETCHGTDLTGVADVPSIAGRSPTYIFRQLYSFKSGARAGAASMPMQGVTAGLGEADMVSLAAYVASLPN
jgi:cytochrome c553